MHDGFENTVLGLLRKRSDLLSDLEHHKNKLAAAMNDLNTLGYDGVLDLAAPRNRIKTFIRHEVRKHILELLRESGQPMTTRELTAQLAAREGRDAGDRIMMLDLTKRVSKSVCHLLDRKVVLRTRAPGEREYRYDLAR